MTIPTPNGPQSEAASPKTGTPDWITCNGCDNRWTGLRTCHCSACHRTFTGLSAFDLHRRYDHCADPTNCGLVIVHKRHWTGWGWPDSGRIRPGSVG